MTDHNTDTHTTNGCTIYQWVYFLAMIILIFTGAFHGPEVLFQIGMGLFLLPFAVGILASAFILIIIAICHPVKGVIMAFVGVNITMIAMHCPGSLFYLLPSCLWTMAIPPLLIHSIWYLCRTSYYQRKAVVRKAVMVHRFTTHTFTTEENNNNNNVDAVDSSSSSSIGGSSTVENKEKEDEDEEEEKVKDYYWVGEYTAPSALQYVTPNNGDEKQTTSIQLIQQQRFHKIFRVTSDFYQAASLEVLVLPGRPNNAMLKKRLEEGRREMVIKLYLFICYSGVWFWFWSSFYNGRPWAVCSHVGWQTYVPFITLNVIVVLAVIFEMWNEYQKMEFAAVAVHNPAGGEQELVTVVGPQNKKEED